MMKKMREEPENKMENTERTKKEILRRDMEVLEEILEVGRRMYQKGYAPANAGNISIRVGANEVWTTPSGVSKGYMTEEMLVKTDLEGNVLFGNRKPSSELKMHLALYQALPEIRSVVHAHPPISTAFAVAGLSLDQAYLQEAVVSPGVVPLIPYALPGSLELAEAVGRGCRGYNALLLENHGVVTWGTDAVHAFYSLETIEHAAATAMYLKIMGQERMMTEEQIDGLIQLRRAWGVQAGGRPRGRTDSGRESKHSDGAKLFES